MPSRVVITDSNLDSDADSRLLVAAGMEAARYNCSTEDDVVAAVSETGADALIVQWAPVSGAVLDAAPSCRFISRLGIGYDMIDVEAATRRGVAVANTPDYCTDEVVAHTVAMALWLLRGLGPLDASVRSGRWSASEPYPTAARPSETTIGVIGLGRIGARVAAQARALGFEVVGHDPYSAPTGGPPVLPLDVLLGRADLVTLHAPLTSQTRRLIRKDTIDLMRPGAVLVNTCRGGLVDEGALVEALSSGRLGGAALDVFEREPLPDDHPLRALPNVLLTPHAAWYSPASLAELPVQGAAQVVDFLTGRHVASIVNPEYAEHQAARRPSA